YVWHESAAAAGKFRSYPYADLSDRVIAGPVVRNADGQPIYFPKTKTPWASAGVSKSAGRRGAYCAFQTGEGTIFTVLDIHTPFNDHSQIQAYTARLYAASREAVRVETVDSSYEMEQVRPTLVGLLQGDLQPPITTAFGAAAGAFVPQLAEDVCEMVFNTLSDQLANGTERSDALRGATLAGVDALLREVKPWVAAGFANGKLVARTAASAGAKAAGYLATAVALPNNATAAAVNGQRVADKARDELNTIYAEPKKKNAAAIHGAMRSAARAAAEKAVRTTAFSSPPTTPVACAVLAGDFNVDYPDTTDYSGIEGAAAKLGGNAYTALLALANPRPAAITARTTSTGPTTFVNQRIFRRNAKPLQHTTFGRDDYAPLDVTSMAGRDFLGYDAWEQELRALASAQGISWQLLVSSLYGPRIRAAFDEAQVINDTQYYVASAYDNMFVRGTQVTASYVIDVLSELGSWQSVAGRWGAALKRLNDIAKAHVQSLNGGLPVRHDYDSGSVEYEITPEVYDAEQAAVFFDKFVSDHLPVFVEIAI
ncbi:MAG TPA: hypothetical protein VEQ60_00780, partial [Longimicrobium sp.]|nr:hypothetical protein [Longimicrobium sp.]